MTWEEDLHPRGEHGKWSHVAGRASDWGREADDSREYAGLHQPNNAAPLHDLTSTETVPDDFYTHMHYYQYGDPEHDRESARAIKAAHGQPDRPVTIYRAAPPGVTHINPGDWITLSRKYAEQHAMQDNDPSHDWPVHEAQVPAKHIGWDVNDINEFGYFGDEPAPVKGMTAGGFDEGAHPRDAEGQWARKVGGAMEAARKAYDSAGISTDGIETKSFPDDASAMAHASRDAVNVGDYFLDDDKVKAWRDSWHQMQVGTHGPKEAATPDDSRAKIMTHEVGHVLARRAYESSPEAAKEMDAHVRGKASRREINPDMKWEYTPDISPEEQVTRWQHDFLGRHHESGSSRSVYATESPYEWQAEALADVALHGDNADESSKRFAAIVRKHLGRQGITSAGRLQAGGGMVADEPTPTTTLAGTCSGPGPCDVHPFGHGKNWVNKVGGLPEYIRAIAHALARQGHSESAAIATAVATVKRWAAGGGKVKPDTRARAAKAVAEWEAKKAAASIDDAESFALGVAEDDTAVETPDVTHAGLAVKAADTGRVLMLQRGIDTPGDEAAGKWEFPGGGLEPDDTTTLHGAVREWQEEVGQPLPKGGVVAETWTAPNGIYQGHVVVIPEEKAVTLHEGRQLLNPDDPHGGGSEQVAWWDPDDAALNPALREEVKSTPWDLIKGAGEGASPAGDDEEESPAGRATPDVFSMVEFLSAFDDEFGDDEEFAWWDAYAKPPAVKAKAKTKPKQQASTASQGGSGFNTKHPRDPFGKFAPLGQGAGYTSDQKGQRENTQVKAVQKMLLHLGISVGPEGVDGMLGPHTRHAVEDFQQRHGLGVNGVVDRKTLEAMKVAAHVKGSAAKAQKAQAKATKAKRQQRIPGLRAQAPGMLPDSAIPRQPAQISMPGYRPNPIVADGTSFEGVPAISLTQPADPGAEFADKVYHYRHGWVSLDHPAAKRGTGLIKEGNLLHRDGEVHEITGVSGEKVRIKSQSTGKVRHLPLSEARHSPVRRPTDKAPEAVQYPAMDDLIKRLREHGLAVDEASLGEALDVADMSFAVEDGDVFASSNRWIRKRGNKWVIIQKGTGKVLQSHDSQEKAERGFRAMMKSKYGGQVSDTTFDLDEGAFADSHEGHVYHFKHGWIPVDGPEAEHGLHAPEHRLLTHALTVHSDHVADTHPAEAGDIDETLDKVDAGKPIHEGKGLDHAHDALMDAGEASGRGGDFYNERRMKAIAKKLQHQEGSALTASAYTDEDITALVAAAITEQPPIELGEDVGGGVAFKIPLVLPTGIETGDRREFKAGGVSSRDLPVPLLWQRFTDDGHKQASIVGRIDKIEPTKNGLGNAEGVFDTGDDAQEALRLVRGLFLRGVSGDVDKIDAEMSQGDDGKPKVIFDKGRLTAATLVAKPAFAECMIELPGDKEWESNMGRLREEGGAPKPLVAAGGPMNPPKEWFQDPGLTEPTHLEVTDDGRVFGHIAAWNQDHIGMPFQKPPRSNSGYRYFTTGQIKTAEGDLLNVGQLTLVGGHADLSYTADMAVKHYDDTNSAVADVVVGEDAFGIWVAGAQRPDLSEHQVRAFRASDPSGDWRPINGNLELVACCQVNVPGFPIPRARARVASGAPGQQPVVTALVAAGAITRERPAQAEVNSVLEARVASLEQADTRRRAAIASELRATVAAGKAMLVKQTKQALVASADDLAAVEFDSPIFDSDPDAGSEDMSGTETDEVSTAK